MLENNAALFRKKYAINFSCLARYLQRSATSELTTWSAEAMQGYA